MPMFRCPITAVLSSVLKCGFPSAPAESSDGICHGTWYDDRILSNSCSKTAMSPERAIALKSMYIKLIRDLYDLATSGAITESEYKLQKDIILGQMSILCVGHWCCIFVFSTAMDMFQSLRKELLSLEEGVVMRDECLGKDVLVVAPVLLAKCDNPQTAELLGHMGAQAKKFCRMCMVCFCAQYNI